MNRTLSHFPLLSHSRFVKINPSLSWLVNIIYVVIDNGNQKQGLFRENYQASATPYMMYQEQNYNQVRESKGTGVFIPRCSQPRRRQHNHPHQKKQGRFGSITPKQQYPHHVYDNNSTTFNNQESITLHHAASINQRRTYRDAASVFT